MRILLATTLMDVGGIERSVVALSRELRARGHETWVVSSGGHLVRDLDRDGTPHLKVPLDLTSPLGMLDSARTIRRLIHDRHIDLIHSFSATASVAVNLAINRLQGSRNGLTRVRLVSSPMGLQNSPDEMWVTTWLRNWFLTLGAERILVISPEIRRHLKGVGARDDEMVDFNFVGLDLDAYHSAPDDKPSVCAEFGFPTTALIVTTIGALHPRKSHELFVDAAAHVLAQVPDAHFLVVGDGDRKAALEARARARRVDGRLVFTGVRDDIPRLLSATDVYVKPGIVEGFIGITVLEALAVGRPVVAFATEDVKLALTDGVTGLLAANADTAGLAERIVFLLQHPEVGVRLGAAGRQLVTERFAFSLLAQRLEEFYLEMVS
jgi:glycosyltransferase involved in cell wall biosynthesis